jgi:hypothetical protein
MHAAVDRLCALRAVAVWQGMCSASKSTVLAELLLLLWDSLRKILLLVTK